MESGTSLVANQPNESSNPEIHTLSPNNVKVMVQDYHSLYLEGFTWTLRQLGFNVIGSSQDATGLIESLHNIGLPDIAIINYKTSSRQTLDLAREVKGNYPEVKVVMNVAANFHVPIDEMKRIGIEGVIYKVHHSTVLFVQALHTVYNGGTYFIP